jgi:tetratricopeptide (TPR) repeat protein
MCAGAYVTAASFEGILIGSDEKTEALKFADMAATLGTDDALALARAAHALVFFGREYERGSAMVERAVALNPNLSSVWLMRGWVNVMSSDLERAEDSFSRVLQFSELDPARTGAYSGMSFCCFYLGRYEEGCTWAAKALQKYVTAVYLRPLIMNAIRAGRKDDARKAAARLLRISPNWRASQIHHARNVELQTAARAALIEAGLPD